MLVLNCCISFVVHLFINIYKGINIGLIVVDGIDEFKELIANGIIKECLECSYPAMKDYDMCNVMHCGKL